MLSQQSDVADTGDNSDGENGAANDADEEETRLDEDEYGRVQDDELSIETLDVLVQNISCAENDWLPARIPMPEDSSDKVLVKPNGGLVSSIMDSVFQ